MKREAIEWVRQAVAVAVIAGHVCRDGKTGEEIKRYSKKHGLSVAVHNHGMGENWDVEVYRHGTRFPLRPPEGVRTIEDALSITIRALKDLP